MEASVVYFHEQVTWPVSRHKPETMKAEKRMSGNIKETGITLECTDIHRTDSLFYSG
jgi:hypothetical protein